MVLSTGMSTVGAYLMRTWHLWRADRPSKWVGRKQLARLLAGDVPGMDEIDVRAVVEGQAVSRLRGYGRCVRDLESD